MKKAIVIVGIVAIAALVLVLFLPALEDVLHPDAGMAANLDVAFYDEDGNQVGSIAFVRLGDRVEDITITLSYSVTSSSEQFEQDLGVLGEVRIEWMVANPGAEFQLAETHTIMSPLAIDSFAWDHNLYNIISVDATGKYYGWVVRIVAELQAQTTMEDGEVVTSNPWSETVQFTLTWESDTLVISGTLGG